MSTTTASTIPADVSDLAAEFAAAVPDEWAHTLRVSESDRFRVSLVAANLIDQYGGARYACQERSTLDPTLWRTLAIVASEVTAAMWVHGIDAMAATRD